jgi:hypothetical protein
VERSDQVHLTGIELDRKWTNWRVHRYSHKGDECLPHRRAAVRFHMRCWDDQSVNAEGEHIVETHLRLPGG